MDDIIFKTELLKGAKGDRGDAGEADSIPVDGVIVYEGETIPDGFEETDAPEAITDIISDIEDMKTATATGEILALVPTSESKALIHTAYGMSVQDGTPTPSSPVDIESTKADFRSVGKNLIPSPWYDSSKDDSGLVYTVNNDGSLTITGTKSGNSDFVLLSRLQDFKMNLVPNQNYKMRIEVLSGSFTGSLIVYYKRYTNPDGSGGATTYIQKEYTSISGAIKDAVEFNIDSEQFVARKVDGIYTHIAANSVATNLVIRLSIINASVQDTTYEPYKKTDLTTNLTLRAIEVSSTDDYNLVRDNKYYIADTLDYSEDNGFVVTRRVGRYDVTGSENWDYVTSDPTKLRIAVPQSDINFYAHGGAAYQGYSSHFTYAGKDTAVISWGNWYWSANNLVISANNNPNITDLTTAKAWLTANKPYFVTVLKTATTESITTEQALALLSLKTYDESTSISSQAEPPCTVAIEYAKERLAAVALIAHNLAKGNDLRIAELEQTP